MGGIEATGCSEVTSDASRLDGEGFWAVQIDYEGRATFAKFEDVTFAVDFQSENAYSPSRESWSTSMDQREYIEYVERARNAISLGDIYQVNACRILTKQYEGRLDGLFNNLLSSNPSPYASYLYLPGKVEIASASPELFIEVCEGEGGERIIKTSPIKGTSKSSDFVEKDYPENVMIVDLMRNDFGSITQTGSVDVPRLFGVEEHPGLFHLVSDVTGTLKSAVSWSEIFSALLPAGSISGAPKYSAKKIIAENEGLRGPYCGVLGWVYDGIAVLSVGIRIFWREDGQLKFGTGAGITWGSNAEDEWNETVLKASRLISIAEGKIRS